MDWAAFAAHMGSLQPDESESCGSLLAYAALEQLVGADVIDTAVDCVVDNAPGRLLAEYVLVRLVSLRATERAYELYRAHDHRAYWAVQLIVRIGHPRSVAWIGKFLADPDVDIAALGMDLLDHFLEPTEFGDVEGLDVERLLAQATQDSRPQIHKRVASTRILLQPEPPSQRDMNYHIAYTEARDSTHPLTS